MTAKLNLLFLMFFQIKITKARRVAQCALECFSPCMFYSSCYLKSKLRQKAVFQSVPLNAFSTVYFILHFFQIQISTKISFADSALEYFILSVLSQKFLQKQARLHSVHFNAFPLYVLISMLFQIKIQQKAVLQSLHLNVFPPVFFILHFLST